MNWWLYLDLPVTLGTCKSVSHEPSTEGQAGLKDGADPNPSLIQSQNLPRYMHLACEYKSII